MPALFQVVLRVASASWLPTIRHCTLNSKSRRLKNFYDGYDRTHMFQMELNVHDTPVRARTAARRQRPTIEGKRYVCMDSSLNFWIAGAAQI